VDAPIQTDTGTGPADTGSGPADAGPADSGPLVVLATGQECPTQVIVRGAYVYWTNRGKGQPPLTMRGAVMRAPKDPIVIDGALQPPTVLAANQQDPGSLYLDGTSYYFWSTTSLDGGIFYCPIGGSASCVTVASHQPGFPSSLAVDSEHVYYSITTPYYRVMRAKRDGGAVSLFGPPESPAYPVPVALEGDDVYWGVYTTIDAGGGIFRSSKMDGMDASALGAVDVPGHILIDDAGLLYSSLVADGGVYRMQLDGGDAHAIASGVPFPRGPAEDETYVYFFAGTNGGNTLYRVPKSGGAPEALIGGQGSFALQGPSVDDTAIYWANCGTGPDHTDGTIVKLPKP
jgi:hypothetical protein